MCDESAARAGEHRHSHRSTGLTIDGLRRADLVLALDRTHATAATQLAPGCRPRMFTLRQAAELASTIIDAATDSQFPEGTSLFSDHPQERLRWLVDQLDSARGTLAEQPEGWEDIPDDHGETTHGATLDEVSTTAHRLAAALATVTAPAHPAPPTTV
jgi:protein-tyrosine-phosphatase